MDQNTEHQQGKREQPYPSIGDHIAGRPGEKENKEKALEEVQWRFTLAQLTPPQREIANQIMASVRDLAGFYVQTADNNRDRAQALTDLDQSAWHMVRAIAFSGKPLGGVITG